MTTDNTTPRPWKVVELDDIFIENENKKPVCIIPANGVYDYNERRSNAHLIAAAPELLDASIRALNFITNNESEFGFTLESGDLLRAAIAKAKGE